MFYPLFLALNTSLTTNRQPLCWGFRSLTVFAAEWWLHADAHGKEKMGGGRLCRNWELVLSAAHLFPLFTPSNAHHSAGDSRRNLLLTPAEPPTNDQPLCRGFRSLTAFAAEWWLLADAQGKEKMDGGRLCRNWELVLSAAHLFPLFTPLRRAPFRRRQPAEWCAADLTACLRRQPAEPQRPIAVSVFRFTFFGTRQSQTANRKPQIVNRQPQKKGAAPRPRPFGFSV